MFITSQLNQFSSPFTFHLKIYTWGWIESKQSSSIHLNKADNKIKNSNRTNPLTYLYTYAKFEILIRIMKIE